MEDAPNDMSYNLQFAGHHCQARAREAGRELDDPLIQGIACARQSSGASRPGPVAFWLTQPEVPAVLSNSGILC